MISITYTYFLKRDYTIMNKYLIVFIIKMVSVEELTVLVS